MRVDPVTCTCVPLDIAAPICDKVCIATMRLDPETCTCVASDITKPTCLLLCLPVSHSTHKTANAILFPPVAELVLPEPFSMPRLAHVCVGLLAIGSVLVGNI